MLLTVIFSHDCFLSSCECVELGNVANPFLYMLLLACLCHDNPIGFEWQVSSWVCTNDTRVASATHDFGGQPPLAGQKMRCPSTQAQCFSVSLFLSLWSLSIIYRTRAYGRIGTIPDHLSCAGQGASEHDF